jgi:hypothetical protein
MPLLMNWKVFGRSEGYFVKQLEGRSLNMTLRYAAQGCRQGGDWV